jgi:formylglycine-generating enzyme required for sulfatase activity
LIRTTFYAGESRLRPLFCSLTGLAASLFVTAACAAPQDPFAQPDVTSILLAQADPDAPATPGLSASDSFELSFWDTIKNSTNPDDYKAYLETYPNGRFSALARVRAHLAAPSPGQPETQPPPARTEQPAIVPVDTEATVVQHATIRATADANGERVGTLEKGERIRITGRLPQGDWVRVLAKSGRSGYVQAGNLKQPDAPPAGSPGDTHAQEPTQPQVASQTPEMPGVADCPDCPPMKPIPGGTFDMGSGAYNDFEKPVHKVKIKPFQLGQYEVTVGQWVKCVADAACASRGPADADASLPITDVTWTEAKAYAAWLSGKTGKHYRLPSEAEWEYAARAGTTTDYYWGASLIRERANCVGCLGVLTRHVLPVGRFPPNAYGLYDMAGNAAEWVEDCWVGTYKGAPADGSAVEKPQCSERALRGGSFISDPRYLRSAARFKYDADVHYYGNGFRVAKEP